MAFQKMRRFKQQLDKTECIRLLEEQPRGTLSVLDTNGYPYGLPIDQWWDPEQRVLCFHCARTGHKMDAIAHCDKATFTTWDEGYREVGDWALNIKSVIVFGRISLVEDAARAEQICRSLCAKFTDDQDYVEHEISKNLARVQCLELVPEHITGKLVNES